MHVRQRPLRAVRLRRCRSSPPSGSFWTNCTTELLATTTEAERQARTRNRCNGEGYESVALIPLRRRRPTLGLLQLNDHARGGSRRS